MVLRPNSYPIFPQKAVPSLWQDVMDELSPRGYGWAIQWSAMLAAASVATSGKMCYRTPDGRIHYHPIFCLASAPPSAGKTYFLNNLLLHPVEAAVSQYLVSANREIVETQVARESWELCVKGKKNALKKAPDSEKRAALEGELTDLMLYEPPKVRQPHILITNGNSKGMAGNALLEWPFAGWVSAEAMQTLSEMRSGDENGIAEMWDGTPLTKVRTSSAIKQVIPHLTLLWMVQNGRWQDYQASSRGKRMRGSGLAARMLFTYTPEDAIADNGIIGPATQEFCRSIRESLLESIAHSRTEWKNVPEAGFSNDATVYRSTLQSRYDRMNRNEQHKDFHDFVGKMLEHTSRVASIFRAMEGGSGEIKLEHLERAEIIVDYHYDVFRYLYEQITIRPLRETDADTLYYWLRKHLKLPDKLQRHVGLELDMSHARMKNAISELFYQNRVKFEQIGGETSLVLRRDADWASQCLVPGGVHPLYSYQSY